MQPSKFEPSTDRMDDLARPVATSVARSPTKYYPAAIESSPVTASMFAAAPSATKPRASEEWDALVHRADGTGCGTALPPRSRPTQATTLPCKSSSRENVPAAALPPPAATHAAPLPFLQHPRPFAAAAAPPPPQMQPRPCEFDRRRDGALLSMHKELGELRSELDAARRAQRRVEGDLAGAGARHAAELAAAEVCMAAGPHGRMAAWLHGGLAAWSYGRMAVRPRGGPTTETARLRGMLNVGRACMHVVQHTHKCMHARLQRPCVDMC
jgi:hypothetical protein